MIPTRIQRIDDFLGGGLMQGIILDIYGPGGAGKTQALLQISAGAAQAGHKIGYIDATGDFRPERILEISQNNIDLEYIRVSRVTNVSEQVSSIRRFSDVSMIVLDNVTDLFAYEYVNENIQHIKNQRLAKHMQEISRVASRQKIPVVMSNMVRYSGSRQVESLGYIVDLYTHVKLYLTGTPNYMAYLRMANKQTQFPYKITHKGIHIPD